MKNRKIAAIASCIAIFLAGTGTMFAAGGGSVLSDAGALKGKHFDPLTAKETAAAALSISGAEEPATTMVSTQLSRFRGAQ